MDVNILDSNFVNNFGTVGLRKNSNINFTDYSDNTPEIDYSDYGVEEVSLSSEQPILDDFIKGAYKAFAKFVESGYKAAENSYFSLTLGLLFSGLISSTGDAMLKGEKASMVSPVLNFSKQMGKELLNKNFVEQNIIKWIDHAVNIPKATTEAGLKTVAKYIFDSGKSLGFKTVLSNLFKYFGCTFAVNVVFNLIFDFADDGKVALGTQIYKAGIMTAFGIVGAMVGHPVLGNTIGAFIADATVNFYDTEYGRGAAGVAVVAGAVLGLAALAAGIVSGPVVLVALAGAAIAAGIVWIIEGLCTGKIVKNAVAIWNFITSW